MSDIYSALRGIEDDELLDRLERNYQRFLPTVPTTSLESLKELEWLVLDREFLLKDPILYAIREQVKNLKNYPVVVESWWTQLVDRYLLRLHDVCIRYRYEVEEEFRKKLDQLHEDDGGGAIRAFKLTVRNLTLLLMPREIDPTRVDYQGFRDESPITAGQIDLQIAELQDAFRGILLEDFWDVSTTVVKEARDAFSALNYQWWRMVIEPVVKDPEFKVKFAAKAVDFLDLLVNL